MTWSTEQAEVLARIGRALEGIERTLPSWWGLGKVHIHLDGEPFAVAFPADWPDHEEFIIEEAPE
jgi:hypothetical protein